MKKLILLCLLPLYLFSNDLNTNILYLELKIKKPPVLSNIIDEPKDLGVMGAKLAVEDSKKTSKFMKQYYFLETAISYDENELIKSYEKFIDEGNNYVLVNAPTYFLEKLLKNKKANKTLFINVANTDTSLRQDYCMPNLIHTIASDAMLYDGLMQFFVKRNFKDLLLIKGENEKDEKIANAIKKSAKKFGAKIVEEKVWDNNSDIRRKATAELPSFTQSDDYDVVVVADYYGDFGEYLYFNTWLPRPIAGTQGLTPKTWHKVIEQWGAAQMQSRFEDFASRWMESEDFASWVAIRTIINSVTRTSTNDLKKNIEYIRSNDFELAAYKGKKLTFRDYNGQVRLPISLVQPRGLISTSPQIGFLHPVTDLDTLGIAPFEMKCKK